MQPNKCINSTNSIKRDKMCRDVRIRCKRSLNTDNLMMTTLKHLCNVYYVHHVLWLVYRH